MGVLLSDVGCSGMDELEYVGSRILWAEFRFARVKECIGLVSGVTKGNRKR